MTKPESLPVEEARKKFADVLDGSQFRSQHTEITRRGKPAGYVVPPEWYASVLEEIEGLRREVASLRKAAPAAAAPRPQVTQAVPERKRPPRGWRGTPLAIRNLADLARERADSGQLARLEQAANAQSEEGKQDHAVLREAYDMGVLTDDDLYAEQPDTTEEPST